ncbi:Uu.00g048190.m01.CDS01 [Anthostomella pinea]|uniref:Uu.00g048190.m01.CDS01 n=1 Tax=Anthostomella pinea TaxID=933095 RepID=A0AAI8VBQ0_9PEZI|nr:Uu.00g048190.m01.CDS01 [Anthostomella pinea]
MANDLASLKSVTSDTCRIYSVDRLLQNRGNRFFVYLATAGDERFVLKNVTEPSFITYQGIFQDLRGSQYLRVPCDKASEQSIFVYRYFSDHLLDLAEEQLPLPTTKRILKDALRGLAYMHDRDIVHTYIKPDNILIRRKDLNSIAVEEVQLADLEDSAHVSVDCAIFGKQVGNWMWRSPEAHASGPVEKPTDMFSFAIVAVHQDTIFFISEDKLAEGEDVLSRVLERQISYFADAEGFSGLMHHLGDSLRVEDFKVALECSNEDNPLKPVALWGHVDPDLRDLVGRLTNFDPAKRLTAREALDHRWFSET